MKETFDVTGMTCAACQANVTKAVSKLEGVSDVDVSLLANSMKVEYDKAVVDATTICQAVSAIGYGARPQNQEVSSSQSKWQAKQEQAKEEQEQSWKRLRISVVFMVVLMYVAMADMMHWPLPAILSGMENALVNALVQIILATIVLFLQRHFFTHGFKALFHKAPNMDSLVALGAGASYLYALYHTFAMAYGMGHHQMELVHRGMHSLYYDSAAMIVTLVGVGKYLEARSKSKTNDALNQLMDLSPKNTTILKDGKEIQIATDQLQVGDIVVMRPGQRVPADGTIIQGNGSLDQSAITGESIPVEKQAGDPVISATINENGSFQFRAEKVGEDTTLSKIIQLVDEAGNSKAPIARIADKVAGVFVPVVIAIAALTFLVWIVLTRDFSMALNNAISVLVISCPCALGLATPVAIMVGTGKAAELGILLKSAEALETLQSIDTVVLDKTGTITSGTPSVQTVISTDNDPNTLVSLAAGLEQGSAHPLARAIVSYAHQTNISPVSCTEYETIPGKGVQANANGHRILGGNEAFLQEQHIDILADLHQKAEELQEEGMTVMFFANENKGLGIIAVADTVRSTSAQAIDTFRQQGLQVVMLTGDNQRTAQALAKTLHLDQVFSNVLPDQKESHVRELQAQGKKVAMVGDGINDAPALVRADVGIAIGAGTDIAMESADIVLMKDSLTDVNTAIDLSRAVIRNIHQNLFWAFFYNIIGIPIAAGLLIPIWGLQLSPMLGAAAMSLSSVSVVTNALRLRAFRPKYTDKEEPIKPTETQHMHIPVEGMMCTHCQQRVHDALMGVEGVKRAVVDWEKGSADVEAEVYVTQAQIHQAVIDAGYQIKEEHEMKKTIKVEGMMCQHCQAHVKEALEKVEGLSDVEVSLEDNQATFVMAEGTEPSVVEQAITDAGYQPKEWV